MIELVLDETEDGAAGTAASALARALAADGLAIVVDPGGAYAYPNLPRDWRESLDRYARRGLRCGGLLTGVLENDLGAVVFRLHAPHDVAQLRDALWYVHNELPDACHGSPAKVAAWLTRDHRPGPNAPTA